MWLGLGTSARGSDSSRLAPHRSGDRPAASPRAAMNWANPRPQRCARWPTNSPLRRTWRGTPATLPPPPSGDRQLRSAAVIRQLRTAFRTAIARAPNVDLDWMRRHFVHHGACSYFVIPNLYSVDSIDDQEQLRALAINQLAGVLADLHLIRPLTP